MLIYEVTATVEPELAASYENYMTEQHIPELLATGYFAAAFFARNGGAIPRWLSRRYTRTI